MQKTLVIMLVVVVLALVGVIVFQKLNQLEPTTIVINQPVVKQPTTNCLEEGEINSTGYNSSEASLDCCAGLKFISVADAWRNPDGSVDSTCNPLKFTTPSAVICTYCGNGVCGKGENQCNCPADCK